MTLNMLSLIGASSPLPAFYNDYLLQDENNVLKSFLDIFHHRLHRLIRSVWQKYRYNAAFREGANDPFSQYIFALLGLKILNCVMMTQLTGLAYFLTLVY